MEGWTVDQITATIPSINLSKAEEEIKADAKENIQLQQSFCQPNIGGDCDILVGMLYKRIFPKEIHMLENGLTIYRLQVTPFNSKYNSAIGGPHESFKNMALNFGGNMSLVFANLCRQLENFQNFGPPSINKPLMSNEDMEFAKRFTYMELKDVHNDYQDQFESDLEDMNEDLEESSQQLVSQAFDKKKLAKERLTMVLLIQYTLRPNTQPLSRHP